MKQCKLVYFDHAATSYPKQRCVCKAVTRAIAEEGGNPGRSAHPLALRAAERIFSAREVIAEFFGLPESQGVIFTKNATEALNLAIAVFTQKGGHVLCDDMAHNALLRPIYALEKQGKIRLSFYPIRANKSIILRQIENDTVLICATHASNICGACADVRAIGEAARARGIAYILDASQSAGHLPINIAEMGADAVCLPAHKGLGGIMGAGAALFLHPEKEYPAFLSGGSGAYSRMHEMPPELPEHFEAGTLPLPAIAAFEAGVKRVKEIGLAEISGHIERLTDKLYAGLYATRGITCHGGAGNGILSFTHKTLPPELLAERLAKEGFALRAGLHCSPLAHQTLGTEKNGTVRISLGYTNTEKECDRFLTALARIIK